MISAIIIDDDKVAIDILSDFLAYAPGLVKLVGTSNNLDDGIKLINEKNPDLVLLDINMPNKSGMEIYNYFNDPSFKIIFVTGYDKYAINAIKKSAVDYLLKPVNYIELRESLQKVSLLLRHERQQNELEKKVNKIIILDIEGKNVLLDFETGFIIENTKYIEYCYADQSYSVIVTYFGKKINISKPLKYLQEILPDNQFYRTHKSYLVNINHIEKYSKLNGNFVHLKSGIKIPVSLRNNSEIVKKIQFMLDN
jgi:two-component system LytT family response regulator